MLFIQQNYSKNPNCVCNTLFALNSQQGIFEPTRPNKLSKFDSAGNYIFKGNNRNTRTRCEICSKLTIKTPERRQ